MLFCSREHGNNATEFTFHNIVRLFLFLKVSSFIMCHYKRHVYFWIITLESGLEISDYYHR